MIRVGLFGDRLSEIDKQVIRYVNDNLKSIIRVLLDLLEDNNGFTASDFLPYNNYDISDEIWEKRVYELYDIVCSSVIRDYIKPKYEYLVYVILKWWEECSDNEEDLLPNQLEDILIEKIKATDEYWSEDGERNFILNAITNFEEYVYILLEDFDFLPDSLERMLVVYLRSPKFFADFFPDTDLYDYYEFMPKDLQEQFDDMQKLLNCIEKNNQQNNLYSDILFCCQKIQANNYYKNALENRINDAMRDLLDALGHDVTDQTRQGTSSGGIEAGEVDLLVKLDKLKFAIIEALKLESIVEKNISTHIDKIYGYDTLGCEYNYLIVYAKCKNFSQFWEKYRSFIKQYKYPHKCIKYSEENIKQFSEIKSALVTLIRNGVETKLYHIVVHIPD